MTRDVLSNEESRTPLRNLSCQATATCPSTWARTADQWWPKLAPKNDVRNLSAQLTEQVWAAWPVGAPSRCAANKDATDAIKRWRFYPGTEPVLRHGEVRTDV
jgi:hypothetical protein